jgi:rhamnose transport system permease protein
MTAGTVSMPRSSVWLTIARFREAGLSVFIIVLVAAVTLRTTDFMRPNNLKLILLNISVLVIVALAQTMVILTKSIDLSVASMIGMVAMMVAAVVKVYPGMPMVLAILLGMALGAILGMINGVIISYGNVPPIIATLGTLSIYRGFVFFYSTGTWVNSYELPDSFKALSKGTPWGLPNMVIWAIAVAIIVFYFLNYTRLGRDIYAVGSNRVAAELSGIRAQRVVLIVFILSGIACGLAAVLWASRYESAQTNTALGYELETVAAAVVGGVSISGGVGRVPGVLLGCLLLGIIEDSLTRVGISPFWQLAAQGLLILIAVVSDNLISRRVQRTQSV